MQNMSATLFIATMFIIRDHMTAANAWLHSERASSSVLLHFRLVTFWLFVCCMAKCLRGAHDFIHSVRFGAELNYRSWQFYDSHEKTDGALSEWDAHWPQPQRGHILKEHMKIIQSPSHHIIVSRESDRVSFSLLSWKNHWEMQIYGGLFTQLNIIGYINCNPHTNNPWNSARKKTIMCWIQHFRSS